MKIPFLTVLAVATLALVGCSAPDKSQPTNEAPAAAASKAPESAAPAPVFVDSFGGNGGVWTMPSTCPSPVDVAVSFATTDFVEPQQEAGGQPFNNGCHYGNVTAGTAFAFFYDTSVKTSADFADTASYQVFAAPSLGPGAFAVYSTSWKLCSVFATPADQSSFQVFEATGIYRGKSPSELCAATAKSMLRFAKQAAA
jgi:hypothetical protein